MSLLSRRQEDRGPDVLTPDPGKQAQPCSSAHRWVKARSVTATPVLSATHVASKRTFCFSQEASQLLAKCVPHCECED